jgi:hypothetical protein
MPLLTLLMCPLRSEFDSHVRATLPAFLQSVNACVLKRSGVEEEARAGMEGLLGELLVVPTVGVALGGPGETVLVGGDDNFIDFGSTLGGVTWTTSSPTHSSTAYSVSACGASKVSAAATIFFHLVPASTSNPFTAELAGHVSAGPDRFQRADQQR